MKNIVATLLLCIPFMLSGQSYIPIPASPTSEWRVYHAYHFKADPCLNVEDFKYYIMGDTLLNSMSYSKLYRSGIYYQMQLGPNSNCDETVHHFWDSYVGALRNDSGKVFFNKSNYPNERLLYDFTLDVGDTLKGRYFLTLGPSIIVSIDSITINNKQHRRFFIDTTFVSVRDSSQYIIEGIGSAVGLLEYSHWESVASLICYAENHTAIYPYGSTCILNIGIEKANIKEQNPPFSYFPNPVIDNLNLSFEKGLSDDAELIIYNAIGQQVYQQKLLVSEKLFTIHLNNLNSGIYFFEIHSNQIRVDAGKFIKE